MPTFRECPHCLFEIPSTATACGHCGRDTALPVDLREKLGSILIKLTGVVGVIAAALIWDKLGRDKPFEAILVIHFVLAVIVPLPLILLLLFVFRGFQRTENVLAFFWIGAVFSYLVGGLSSAAVSKYFDGSGRAGLATGVILGIAIHAGLWRIFSQGEKAPPP